MGILGGALRSGAVLCIILGAGLSVSCSEDPSNPVSGGLTAVFTPLSPNPPSLSVTMQAGSTADDVFNVRISAKDVNDFFGAAFHVVFNRATAQYVGFNSSTSFLNGTGILPGSSFQVFQGNPGVGNLSVIATRFQNASGTVPGVNVTNGDLIVLTFRALGSTSGNTFSFGLPREVQVCGATGPTCETKVVAWNGGTLTAN